MFDLAIRNGFVVDGLGRPGYRADLAVVGGRIAAVGDLADQSAETTLDAAGMVVCPGFIDLHTHSDFTLLVNRHAESAVHQGVTTVVTGQCGHGPAPVRDPELIVLNLIGYHPAWGIPITWRSFGDYLDRLETGGLAVNVMPLVSHGAIRLAVMGFAEQPATQAEIEEMVSLTEEALEEGAAGLSWGLEYSPGRYANRPEMDALSRIVAQHGGLYHIHVRDRGDSLLRATEEAVSVAEQAGLPLHLSHFAPRPYAAPGAFDAALSRLDLARRRGIRVGLDVFPRIWGLSTLAALLPPSICAGPARQALARLRQPAVRQEIRRHFQLEPSYVLRARGPQGVVLVYAPGSPDLVGLNLAQIAEARQSDMSEAVCDILLAEAENLYNALVRHVFATPADLETLLAQPHCALASDGVASAPYGRLADLRTTRDSYGYTARFLQEYVRERRRFTLEEAVYRMTGLPALLCDLSDRGRLAEDAVADIVIFDAERIEDRTTDMDMNRYPAGIEWVIVSGQLILDHGEHTGRLPGVVLRGTHGSRVPRVGTA